MEKYPGWLNLNDTYKIKKDIYEIKKIIEDIEKDMRDFLGNRKVKYKSEKARGKISRLKNKTLPELYRKIGKQRQDYDSDYD